MQTTRFPARATPSERMADFIAHLRMNGMPLGPTEGAAALEALTHVDALSPEEVRRALKVLLVPDADRWRGFDALFDAFWFNLGKTREGTPQASVHSRSSRPTLWQPHFASSGGDDTEADMTPSTEDGEAEGVEGNLIATRTEALSQRDLRNLMDEASLREAEAAARKIARAIRDRRSRRRRQARWGRELDMRRTLRVAISKGDAFDLHHRTQPPRPMRIVAMCDVSGSMTVYARVFLAFLKGLLDAQTGAEAFLFHTRLIRVTQALQDHDSLRAATRLSLMAEGFGGGTDIGAAINALTDRHGYALTGRSIVLILSDGYCTGAPEALSQSLARLRRKTRRIVWLNPLMGWHDYAPVNAAMKAALPHLDAHLPANTLDALARLEPEFARL